MLQSRGVHFSDAGVGILKDCAATDDCAVWLGSGSVWKRLSGDPDQEVEEYIMNFSQVRNRS